MHFFYNVCISNSDDDEISGLVWETNLESLTYL